MTTAPIKLAENLKGITFLSKAAGAFSTVPQRTVQAWTEAGFIVAGTAGTGDRRRYPVLSCIEIGIVKSLRRDRLDSRIVAAIMGFLRKYRPSNLERLLGEEEGYLVVRLARTGRITPHLFGYASAREENESLMKYWRLITMPRDCDKTLVVNVGRIGKEVIANILSFLSR